MRSHETTLVLNIAYFMTWASILGTNFCFLSDVSMIFSKFILNTSISFLNSLISSLYDSSLSASASFRLSFRLWTSSPVIYPNSTCSLRFTYVLKVYFSLIYVYPAIRYCSMLSTHLTITLKIYGEVIVNYSFSVLNLPIVSGSFLPIL